MTANLSSRMRRIRRYTGALTALVAILAGVAFAFFADTVTADGQSATGGDLTFHTDLSETPITAEGLYPVNHDSPTTKPGSDYTDSGEFYVHNSTPVPVQFRLEALSDNYDNAKARRQAFGGTSPELNLDDTVDYDGACTPNAGYDCTAAVADPDAAQVFDEDVMHQWESLYIRIERDRLSPGFKDLNDDHTLYFQGRLKDLGIRSLTADESDIILSKNETRNFVWTMWLLNDKTYPQRQMLTTNFEMLVNGLTPPADNIEDKTGESFPGDDLDPRSLQDEEHQDGGTEDDATTAPSDDSGA